MIFNFSEKKCGPGTNGPGPPGRNGPREYFEEMIFDFFRTVIYYFSGKALWAGPERVGPGGPARDSGKKLRK